MGACACDPGRSESLSRPFLSQTPETLDAHRCNKQGASSSKILEMLNVADLLGGTLFQASGSDGHRPEKRKFQLLEHIVDTKTTA